MPSDRLPLVSPQNRKLSRQVRSEAQSGLSPEEIRDICRQRREFWEYVRRLGPGEDGRLSLACDVSGTGCARAGCEITTDRRPPLSCFGDHWARHWCGQVAVGDRPWVDVVLAPDRAGAMLKDCNSKVRRSARLSILGSWYYLASV